MAEFPFQLVIKRISPTEVKESLLCTSVLRSIPGRRQIYDARWNDQHVVAKVFSHTIKARYHLRREWRGLDQLQKRGLNAPKPLFYGKAEDGRWVIVSQKILDSATLLDVLSATTEKSKELALFVEAAGELAKQHSKGVIQQDLHLGNFLKAGEKIYALDPGQMQFFPSAVPRERSVSHLAMLAGYLPTGEAESVGTVCKKYFQARQWHFEKSDEALLRKQVGVHRKKAIRHGLRKCLRTSRRCRRIESGRCAAVFDKSFLGRAEAADFIRQIDAVMDEGKILKKGNTCFVSRLTWEGQDIVIKRYNHKGFIHSLRHTIKGSRARRGWLCAHRLVMLDIPTPKPLAFIERRKGRLILNSYLVTEFVEGKSLHDFLQDHNVAQEQRLKMARRVVSLLDQMAEHNITHGDLKHSNILVTGTGPVLTDLDGMKVHALGRQCRLRHLKDVKRFTSELSIGPGIA
ncbi:MAG: lipopolysaccharide kinase InaA family protein [Planctomycetota bacterium]|jgi:tRNA A-37 threonylcarbamoyl transferase component Bud32